MRKGLAFRVALASCGNVRCFVFLLVLAGCDQAGTSAVPPDATADAAGAVDAPEAEPVDDAEAGARPAGDGGPTSCIAEAGVENCKSGDPRAPQADLSIPVDGTGSVTMSVETSEPAQGFDGVCLTDQPSLYATAVLPQVCYTVEASAGVEETDWATFTVPAAVVSTYPYFETCGTAEGCSAVSRSCCGPPIAFVVQGASATGQVFDVLQSDED